MAANAILPSAGAGQSNIAQTDDDFESRLIQALTEGDTSYTISFSGCFAGSSIGSEQLSSLKQQVEFQLGSHVDMNVDVSRNTVTTRALGQINPPAIIDEASPDNAMRFRDDDGPAEMSSEKPVKKAKVPRPPNAFIIYRKEWHARVVAENPGLHNNAISIIIGRKWKEENQAVKDHYQRKAMEAKHQHQLANPNYHYQPRKPSEKKKRMTKTKMARLAAKNAAALNHPASIQNQANDFATTAEQMDLPIFDCGPKLDTTSKPGYVSFVAGPDPNGIFANELHAHTAANTSSVNPALNGLLPTLTTLEPTSDSLDVADLESFPVELPDDDTGLYGIDAFDLTDNVNTPNISYSVVSAPSVHTPQFDNFVVNDSEVFRQEELDDLFDFDSFSYSI